MSFKTLVLFACVAAISCAQFDSREQEEAFASRQQNDALKQFNDQRRLQDQDKFEENRKFENQDRFNYERRFQDRFEQDQRNQGRLDNPNNRGILNGRAFPQQTTFLHLQPAVLNVQSSSRRFNVQDDSNYDVAYSVSDVTTGDIKTHQETRRGDEVQGQYTILDSDGFQRKVNYRANDRDGFDAEVSREPVIGFEFRYPAQNNNNFQIFANDFDAEHQFNGFNKAHSQTHQAIQPKAFATTSVSKTEDGQHNQYTVQTTTNN